MTHIRTRFAPSPTGKLHLGSAHTALYCWLYARRFDGEFILRIEDTDRERSTKENVDVILDGMEWLELKFEEGPFYQTERLDEYKKAIDLVLAKGMAYRCTCKAEDLAAKREKAIAEKRTYLYDRTCRDANHGPDCGSHVIRFKMPIGGQTTISDMIKGSRSFPNSELDDWIIARTDGSPTYNFCVVVDDADMKISHVIRGDDHLNNLFKQVHVYAALGCELPVFAHMSLIHGQDGAKLSKRHGATSVTAYRDMGYLPIAVRNYLARLGWAHGDQEIFSDEEMIEHFDPSELSKSYSTFDMEKFRWVNEQHMRNMDPAELAKFLMPFLLERGYKVEEGPWLNKMIENFTGRTSTLVEIADWVKFLFIDDDDLEYDAKAAKKNLRPVALEPIVAFRDELEKLENFDEASIAPVMDSVLAKFDIKLGKLAQPVRVAVTGAGNSPGIHETLALLGRERTLARIDKAIVFIKNRAAG